MITTISEIIEAIKKNQLREHVYSNVELKEDWSQKYGEKLSALANRLEIPISWLIIGITNNGGLAAKDEKWAKQREEIISQQINDYLDPIQTCIGINCYEINGYWIIAISLKNPGEVVYWNKNAYIASGTTIKEMEPDAILKLRIMLPGLSDFSKQAITNNYDKDLISLFELKVSKTGRPIEYRGQAESNSNEILNKLGIYGKQVARILFGDCSYRFVTYDSNGKPINNLKLNGLYRLLTDEFINEIQQWSAEQAVTVTEPYPKLALKESLANAVAHAAYFQNDGEIIIEIYPDRISIGNLCVRESVYFANRWFSRSHRTINGLLMEVLRIAAHVDELGRGKNLIFSESIKNGKRSPEVILERAGRYDRWKLILYGGGRDEIQLRLLERVRSIYKDEQNALIAYSLVLWRDKPVSEIRNYIDGDFSRQFAEVLSSLKGPIFYWKEQDRIVLTRWASILLGEGKDSKTLSPAEEQQLRIFAYNMQTQYHEGYITPKDLRELARMGHTPSEQSLSSKLLSKWDSEDFVKKIRKGVYQFKKKNESTLPDFSELLKILQQQISK